MKKLTLDHLLAKSKLSPLPKNWALAFQDVTVKKRDLSATVNIYQEISHAGIGWYSGFLDDLTSDTILRKVYGKDIIATWKEEIGGRPYNTPTDLGLLVAIPELKQDYDGYNILKRMFTSIVNEDFLILFKEIKPLTKMAQKFAKKLTLANPYRFSLDTMFERGDGNYDSDNARELLCYAVIDTYVAMKNDIQDALAELEPPAGIRVRYWELYRNLIKQSQTKKIVGSQMKKKIYEKSKATISYLESNGINFSPFLNLSNPLKVIACVNQVDKASALYAHLSHGMHQLGVKLSKDYFSMYADEICYLFESYFQKHPDKTQHAIEKHINESFYRDTIRFGFADRDQEDRKLALRCGNRSYGSNKIDGWVANIAHQFLKLYDEQDKKRFIGYLSIFLSEDNGIDLIVDATEFVPQVRTIPSYSERAKLCLKQGLEKLKDISQAMNIHRIGAIPYPNVKGIFDYYTELGYTEHENFLINPVVKVNLSNVAEMYDIEYTTRAFNVLYHVAETRGFLKFNKMLEENFYADPSRKEHLTSLIRERDFEQATQVVMDYCEAADDLMQLKSIFKTSTDYDDWRCDVKDALESLSEEIPRREVNLVRVM